MNIGNEGSVICLKGCVMHIYNQFTYMY